MKPEQALLYAQYYLLMRAAACEENGPASVALEAAVDACGLQNEDRAGPPTPEEFDALFAAAQARLGGA